MPRRQPRAKAAEPTQADILAEVQRNRERRQGGYRERALALFPHVCARCGREFAGKQLRELTVHHIDHNHDNNPPDGSNWELLCLYCHDNEHSVNPNAAGGAGTIERHGGGDLGFRPFEGLQGLVPPDDSPKDDA